MLKLSFLSQNKLKSIKLLKIKNFDAKDLINELIILDEKRKKIQTNLDQTLNKINNLSKEIGNDFKNGNINLANSKKETTLSLKEQSKDLTESLKITQKLIKSKLVLIPNIPNSSVPQGNNELNNEIIFKKGEIPNLDSNARPHWEIAVNKNIIDFENGVNVTGAGFPVFIGKGAKLQRGLINYFLDKNINAGYKEISPPLVVNENSAFGTGQLPDKDRQMYHVKEDNLYLIPTAEVPLTNLYKNKILNEKDLPINLTAYSPCFRREAGSYGKNVRGLNRLHQFDKVEIVKIDRPSNSNTSLQSMVNHISSILSELNLPYRMLKLCGGDTSFASSITYDFEVFSAAQKKWLEVSSVSNFEDFQANRLNLRFKNKENKIEFCHTLNGSSLALPRIIAAILENNQINEKIFIPKILHSYCGFSEI
tara:strand:+ start:437 stop:1705 length:1269 start_codon:yes stop_codon:yes gene_type:complete